MLKALAFEQAKGELARIFPIHHGPHHYYYMPKWFVWEIYKKILANTW